MERQGALFGQVLTYYSNPLLRLDEWILQVTNATQRGTYVEIYAGDGITDSSTYALAKNGWTGTLVEPDQGLFTSLGQHRPESHLIRASVGPGRRENVPVADLRSIVETVPEIDFLVLVTGMDFPVLATYFADTPVNELRRFKNLAVGWSLQAVKLARIRQILEPHDYILKEVRGWSACFQTKEEASRPTLAY